ncbi:MAG: DUF805 domain-containing protein [Dokdonella sp.]
MNWKNLLFSFEGRVGRGPYWMFLIVMLVVFGGLSALSVMTKLNAEDPSGASGMVSMPMIIASLALIWPALAVQAKRWHDVDKSAWWILIGLVPVVGGLVALVFNGFIAGTPGSNRFGPARTDVSASEAAMARS